MSKFIRHVLFANGVGRYTRSEEILNKGIKFHDFSDRWDNYHGKVHLTTFFADQKDPSNEIIEINTKEGYWKCTTISADSTYVRGIKDVTVLRKLTALYTREMIK